MIYFYCTSWQFFQMIVKWRISPTTEQIMFTFSILLFHFYSHIPYGMWRIPKLKHFVLLRFLLTHPVWDVTLFSDIIKLSSYNFYSHIPCGMWRLVCKIHRRWRNFYSHIPCGMWPVLTPFSLIAPMISTHTSRVGCDNALDTTIQQMFAISTHTSRVGCDASGMTWIHIRIISTHTSRVGCDVFWFPTISIVKIFLLTHPVWDVTSFPL